MVSAPGFCTPRMDMQAHALDRHVGDVRLAGERHDVMLAMGMERDIADEDEIVVRSDLGEGAVEDVDRAFAIAAEQLLIGADDALRGVHEALARGIIAHIGNERPHRRLRFLARGLWAHRRRGGSYVIRQRRLGKRLDDSVHRRSPFDRRRDEGRAPEVSPGGRVSYTPRIEPRGNGRRNPTIRISHGLAARTPPYTQSAAPFSRRLTSPYIFFQGLCAIHGNRDSP